MVDPLVADMKRWKDEKTKSDPVVQDMARWKAQKESYRRPDTISSVGRMVIPGVAQIAGELGGGALGTLAEGGVPGPGTVAGFISGGAAGGTLGSSAADYVDYKRGMGPEPTFKGQAEAAPKRLGINALGSALGLALPGML